MLKSDIADDDDRAALVAKSVIIQGATEITLQSAAQSPVFLSRKQLFQD